MTIINPHTGRSTEEEELMERLLNWMKDPRVINTLLTQRVTHRLELAMVMASVADRKLTERGLWMVVQWLLQNRKVRRTIIAVTAKKEGLRLCAAKEKIRQLEEWAKERFRAREKTLIIQ